ncbi:MAG: NADPH:quinone oxidoreductase [Pseudolabrys sp.]|jgi:NAD(P)H-dependent FMN reductase|nr:NADPH:quinone oxidoreductase [Pseudolabrys sp.]
MAAPKILVIPGSLRSGSFNARLAALAAKELTLLDAEVTRISLEDFPLPLYDPDDEMRGGPHGNAVRLKQLFTAHQGVFIASPEYNGSVSPLLKNTIDWVSQARERGDPPYAAFRHRIFAIASASTEFAGGQAGLMALRQILTLGCGALVLPEQVAVPHAAQAFDEMGNLSSIGLAAALRSELARMVEITRDMM